jgi:hypothetical protein
MKNLKSDKIFTHSERMMHQSWCLKNDILIYFQPLDYSTGCLMISEKGKIFRNAEIYIQPTKTRKLKNSDKKWWQEIMKLYTSKYLEYNK